MRDEVLSLLELFFKIEEEAARPPWLSPQTVARPRSSLKLRRPQPHLGLDLHHLCQPLLLLHNQHLVSESEVELQDGRQSFELQPTRPPWQLLLVLYLFRQPLRRHLPHLLHAHPAHFTTFCPHHHPADGAGSCPWEDQRC